MDEDPFYKTHVLKAKQLFEWWIIMIPLSRWGQTLDQTFSCFPMCTFSLFVTSSDLARPIALCDFYEYIFPVLFSIFNKNSWTKKCCICTNLLIDYHFSDVKRLECCTSKDKLSLVIFSPCRVCWMCFSVCDLTSLVTIKQIIWNVELDP